MNWELISYLSMLKQFLPNLERHESPLQGLAGRPNIFYNYLHLKALL